MRVPAVFTLAALLAAGVGVFSQMAWPKRVEDMTPSRTPVESETERQHRGSGGEVTGLYRPNQCGPIALCTVLKLHGINSSLPELADLCGTTPDGTSIYGLARAASVKGLTAQPMKANIDYLKRLDQPAIIDLPSGHYCVLAGWRDDRAIILDPPKPTRLWPVPYLRHYWGRRVIVFSRAETDRPQ